MVANANRFVELGMAPELATEVKAQIDANLPVTPDSIVNADINSAAAIDLSKLATGSLPSGIKVAHANITAGTIVNADINAAAAIASTKLSSTTLVAALVALTDNSGGTPSDTIPDVPGSYTEATLANQIASLTTKINAIITAIKS
jgi:hypothetical protein